MLSKEALAYLASRTYRADAVRQINFIPLTGIYWEDEFPVFGGNKILPEEDFSQVMQMFKLRAALWKGKELREKQKEFWDGVYATVPQWALFKRMKVSEEDLQAEDFANKTMDDFEAEMIAEADEVHFTEDEGHEAKYSLKPNEPDENEDEPDGKPRIQ
jgi:hypothetical protein